MAILNGPLIFLTDANRGGLDALDAITQLANATARPASVLVTVPQRMEDTLADKLVESVRTRVPAGELDVQGARPNDLRPTLAAVAESTGGIVALVPTHRRRLSRVLASNSFERLLHDGPLPVLTIPYPERVGVIKRVLFPADFSPRSEALLHEAIMLCKQLDAELHLLHVYGPDRLLESEIDIDTRSDAETPMDLLKIDEAHLERMRQAALAQGVQAVTATAEGRAHTAILAYIAATSIDLVVMASHGPRSSQDIFTGTTSVRVMLRTPVPVLAAHV